MAYIFDDKKALGAFVVPQTSTPVVAALEDTQIKATFSIGPTDPQKYVFPTTRAPGPNYSLVDTKGNGVLEWAIAGADGCAFTFVRITDPGTTYNLTLSDCAVEIVNDSYTTVVLPPAAGNGGKTYFVVRGSNTDTLTLVPSGSDTIDGAASMRFKYKYEHTYVGSNDVNRWYVI